MQLLSLCVVLTAIRMTTSQPTHDVTYQNNDDVIGCASTEQMLKQLITMNHQQQSAISQLQSANSQLQREIAEIKAAVVQGDVTGRPNNCMFWLGFRPPKSLLSLKVNDPHM